MSGRQAANTKRILTLTLFLASCNGSSTSSNTSPSSPSVTVASVTVTGNAPAVGTASQFAARASMSDGTTQDVTASATWQSTNTGVANATIAGIVNGVSAGSTTIMATYQSVTGTLAITVVIPIVTTP